MHVHCALYSSRSMINIYFILCRVFVYIIIVKTRKIVNDDMDIRRLLQL